MWRLLLGGRRVPLGRRQYPLRAILLIRVLLKGPTDKRSSSLALLLRASKAISRTRFGAHTRAKGACSIGVPVAFFCLFAGDSVQRYSRASPYRIYMLCIIASPPFASIGAEERVAVRLFIVARKVRAAESHQRTLCRLHRLLPCTSIGITREGPETCHTALRAVCRCQVLVFRLCRRPGR